MSVPYILLFTMRVEPRDQPALDGNGHRHPRVVRRHTHLGVGPCTPCIGGRHCIPRRCIAECLPRGGPPLAWPLSPAQLATMYAKSPISVVGNVRAPSLMLLGAADQRVPHSQGREWVAALQSQPSPPTVVALEYPGEGHAIGGAEQQALQPHDW